MAKDPTSRRKRGFHTLNDRLLALKNLVRARNEEITMEYSREYELTEDESSEGDNETDGQFNSCD